MRTATLDLNSRGSFVDDLNSKPGIVMCRDALLHRSHEIQPAFYDSEKKFLHRAFFSFIFFLLVMGTVRDTGGAPWPFVILVHNFSTSFFFCTGFAVLRGNKFY